MAAKNNGASGGKITKNEAVRRALAELGRDAKLAELQAWIKDRFGFEMSTTHISTSKGDFLRKQAGKDQPATMTPAPAPIASPTNGAQAGASSKAAKLTKTDAMRAALAELGRDAKPAAIQAFLKDHFNLEMTTQLIYKYKSDLKATKKRAKKATTSKSNLKPTAPPAPTPTAPTQGGQGKGGILLDDILTVKSLVQRLGRDQLRELIAALAK